MEKELEGLRGWLVFFLILVVTVSIGTFVLGLYQITYVNIFIAGMNIVFSLFSAYVFVQLLSKKKKAVMLIYSWLMFNFIIAVVSYFMGDVTSLIWTSAFIVIWAGYFDKSERVKRTLTN